MYYSQSIDQPRINSVRGGELPSARKVSNLLMKCDKERKSDKNSVMVMAWGQFLDHDIVATPVSKGKIYLYTKLFLLKNYR
ncbi:hypothetical protein KUTeg_008053 [Tegillarca granosa]|uniref:Uncharacterized protein n=1 Tax=Tegillarca granosa TaxID=220873 RepID=A0ABQ9F800_TEGGR|nr:hypothetical protein KUTeg_008053 [Tegillarca granosa]